MEACGKKPIRGLSENIVAVVTAIERAGFELGSDGSVRPMPRKVR
jgi:hypothetical protein